MDTIAIDQDNLKEIIKQAVREAIKEERFILTESLIPHVSDEEMNDIISIYGEHPADAEFVDMTDWIRE